MAFDLDPHDHDSPNVAQGVSPSFERNGSGPVALASGQPVTNLLALEVVPGRVGPGPGESLDHSHIDETDGDAVDLAGHHWDRTAFLAHVKIGGAMAEPEFVHVFRRFDGYAHFPIGIGGRDTAVLEAERALAFPHGKLGVRLVGGEHEADVAAIARSAKLSFPLCHSGPTFRL